MKLKSKKLFAKTNKRTKKVNLPLYGFRGGIRL